jgi:hypothetical protein
MPRDIFTGQNFDYDAYGEAESDYNLYLNEQMIDNAIQGLDMDNPVNLIVSDILNQPGNVGNQEFWYNQFQGGKSEPSLMSLINATNTNSTGTKDDPNLQDVPVNTLASEGTWKENWDSDIGAHYDAKTGQYVGISFKEALPWILMATPTPFGKIKAAKTALGYGGRVLKGSKKHLKKAWDWVRGTPKPPPVKPPSTIIKPGVI